VSAASHPGRAPSISVIMPTRNGARYIVEALESIASQSRIPDEIVLSDDASTDDTRILVRRFAERSRIAVSLHEHTPSGVTDNYLNALSKATGDIIIVSDQDDVWVPGKVAVLESCFAADPHTSIVCADSMIVDSALTPMGRTLRGDARKSTALSKIINGEEGFTEFLRGGLPLLAHTLSFRSDLMPLLLAKPADIPEWWFEEWVACVAATLGTLRFADQALTLYRQHPAQTAGAAPKHAQFTHAARGKYALRVRKLEFCRAILVDSKAHRFIGAKEISRRIRLIDAYVQFLRRREAIASVSALPAWQQATRLLTSGAYNRFSSGFWSFGRDVLSKIGI
jgi:glycosyltransferase involved in cell wall biosynthesis